MWLSLLATMSHSLPITLKANMPTMVGRSNGYGMTFNATVHYLRAQLLYADTSIKTKLAQYEFMVYGY